MLEFKKGTTIGIVRSKNRQDFYKIKRFLYGSYALTDKGILKFDFLGYMKGCQVLFADVILPRVNNEATE